MPSAPGAAISTGASAMAPLTLAAFQGLGRVELKDAYEIGNGIVLKAPTLNGAPIVLDLTSDDDTWVTVVPGFDYFQNCVLPHHTDSGAIALKLGLLLPEGWAEPLGKLDKEIRDNAMRLDDTKLYNWLNLLRNPEYLVASIVVSGSATPTIMRFLAPDGSMTMGTGLEFLQAQMQGSSFTDFDCKVWLELQLVECNLEKHRMSTTLKIHSIVFAKRPVAEIMDYNDDHLASIVRAGAKRRRAAV